VFEIAGFHGEQKMRSRRITAVIVAAFGASVLWSSVAAAADQPAKKKNSDDPNRRICKMVIPTGSRMGERVCRTAAEWQSDQDKAEQHLQETRDATRG
jgi:hypothetical protein